MGSLHLAAPPRAHVDAAFGAVPLERQGGRKGTLYLVLAVCVAAQVVAGVLLTRSGGFWSPDSAVRFLQVHSLLASDYHHLSVPYPATALDPEGRYFPIGGWFHFGRAGRFYLSYLPYFSVASAPLYRLLGFSGLLLIPAAAVLGAVWITYGVLRRHAPDLAGAAALTLGLATPLFIYGVVFWDHSLAVLLAAGALAILVREIDGGVPLRFWRMITAGTLLGLGFWVRSESYVLGIAVALGWLIASPRARVPGILMMVLGMAVPAGCLWALNTHLFGSPFGWKGQDLVATRVGAALHAASGGTAGAASWIDERLGNAYYQLASPDFYAFNPHAVTVGLATAIAFVLAGILLRMGVRKRARAVIVTGTFVGVGACLVTLSARTMVSGLLPAAPVVILAMLAGPAVPWERFLWATSALFTGAVIGTGTHGGLQWGPRYLLSILPALVWLAAANVERMRDSAPEVWPSLRLAGAALLCSSLFIQVSGMDQVAQATARNDRLNQFLRTVPADIIITPLQWLTLGAGPLYFEKQFMLVQTPEDLKALVKGLSDRHVTRWAYIPYGGPAFFSGTIERWTTDHKWRFRSAEDRTFEGIRYVTYIGKPGEP